MRSIWILLMLSCVVIKIQAQSDSITSVELKESHVIYVNGSNEDIATTTVSVDSLLESGTQDLALALSELPSVWVRSYGVSGASSAVFRGTSAAHTQVFWNGINVNSLTIGQADLRTIRFSAGQDLTVNSGLASLNDGSGGLGGSIHLNDKISFSDQLSASLSAGSFGLRSGSLSGNYTLGKWTFSTGGTVLNAINNFQFANTSLANDPIERRSDEQMSALTLNQSVSRRVGKNNILTAHFLYSDLERGVADPITSSQTAGVLADLQKRALINWKRIGKVHLEAVAYVGEEYMSYDQNVHSQYTIVSRALNGSAKYSFKNHHSLDCSSENSWSSVESSGFQTQKEVSRHSAKLKYTYEKGKLKAQTVLRQEVFRGEFSKPMGVVSLQYEIKDAVTLHSSAGRTFRFAALNDLYWLPGGNPELKPESGYSVEAGAQIQKKDIRLKVNGYASQNSNLIVWKPIQGNFTPINVSQARIMGLELELGYSKKLREKYLLDLALNNSFNKAEELIDEEYRALPFRPLFHTASSIRLSGKGMAIMANYSYMSERTGFNESDIPLESIHLVDVSASVQLKTAEHFSARIELKVNNLFSEVYEYVRWYPMPGRNIQINLNIKLK